MKSNIIRLQRHGAEKWFKTYGREDRNFYITPYDYEELSTGELIDDVIKKSYDSLDEYEEEFINRRLHGTRPPFVTYWYIQQ